MSAPKILVAGSLNMDMIFSADRFPESGETTLGGSFTTAHGGKGANQALGAARLGAKVAMLGRVGNDDFGRAMKSSLEREGVDVSRVVESDGVSSGVAAIVLEKTESGAKNRILVIPGANGKVTPADAEPLKRDIADFDMVMLQHEIPLETNAAIVDVAFEAGVPVMLNPAPSAAVSDGLLKKLAYISPNEHEAFDITGVKIENDADAERAADVFLSRGVKNVIITLGKNGAAFKNADGFVKVPIVEGVTSIDPTAAGDSFVSAFCVAICSGKTAKESLDFASRAAAITVSRMGAQPSLPTLAELTAR